LRRLEKNSPEVKPKISIGKRFSLQAAEQAKHSQAQNRKIKKGQSKGFKYECNKRAEISAKTYPTPTDKSREMERKPHEI